MKRGLFFVLAAGLLIGVAACEDPNAAPPTPGSPGQTAAPSPTTGEGQTTSEEDSSGNPLLLLMDYSGSMEDPDANGDVRIDSAREALHGVVDALPDDQQVGLRVYGHSIDTPVKSEGCEDTELVHPVTPLDRDGLNEAIDSYEPLGWTPIGLSLQNAAGDLPDGSGTIVLVSDGEDTCAPPAPCEVADQLAADHPELTIHTVGFALEDNDAAREELQCIAEAGRGEYRDAGDAGALAAAIASSRC